ncbi:hypothetical protein H0H93_005799 [Arthromyces matolae]|nr:hypothetical protein H0H93_005799 [Arthromyces matolae]
MAKGKNLKAALQSQQSRFKAKEKLSHAAQVSQQRYNKNTKRPIHNTPTPSPSSNKGKGKALPAPPPRRTTIPFRSVDTILLIGEGNFSFARALINDPPPELHDLPPSNLTATAYDTEDECYEKYDDLLPRSCRLDHKRKKSGNDDDDDDDNGVANGDAEADIPVETEEDSEEIKFVIPKEIVKTRGTVLITLRNVVPYTSWYGCIDFSRTRAEFLPRDIPRLAKKPPKPTNASTPPNPHYTLLRSFGFNRSVYKGYEHRMTKGIRAHGTGKTGEGGEDRTWEFCLQDD